MHLYRSDENISFTPYPFSSDFLTTSYDIGGVISVMALNGLFVLMTQHGLEYPKFYEKLYALLTPAVFLAKHRAVFFQVSFVKAAFMRFYFY